MRYLRQLIDSGLLLGVFPLIQSVNYLVATDGMSLPGCDNCDPNIP
jgi:hypothetical protein